MDIFNSVDEILDFAIKAEQDAVDFYTDLSKSMVHPEMQSVFIEFAQEEVKHKAKLTKVKEENIFELSKEKIADLKIADYTVVIKPNPDMSYQDALILAMNREKAAFKLYTKLSTKTDDANLKSLFLSLAQEESKHKLRFELEYDEFILKEN
jgi:rubrerythrin